MLCDRANNRNGLPVTVRDFVDAAFSAHRPAVAPCHVGLRPRFIEKHPSIGFHESAGNGEVASTPGHIRSILFGGDQRLFFNRNPRAISRRSTVDSTTSAWINRISSLAVMPGLAFTC